MASSYVNNLRLEEIATGEQSGTWGDTTNTNLEIIGQAVAWGTRAIANASSDNITIADGALDADRCLGLKLTGGGQACLVTLLPNTSSKTWFMYNATAAALTFTCGGGANVIIPAGHTKVIATDGLGSGGVVHDLLTAVNLAGVTTVDDLIVSDDLVVADDASVGGILGVTGVLTTTAAAVFNGGFTSNGTAATFASSTANSPNIIFKNTTNDANAPIMDFITDKGAAGADGDSLGLIRFTGDNDAQQQTTFARVLATVADASDGAEGGKLELQVATHDGEIKSGLIINDGSAEDEIDVTIGFGTASNTIISGKVLAANGGAGLPSHSFSGDTNTGMFRRGADQIGFSSGGTEFVAMGSFGVAVDKMTNKSSGATIDIQAPVTFNDNGANVDFRVASSGNASMLFVDGGNDVVSVGTQSFDARVGQPFCVTTGGGTDRGGMSISAYGPASSAGPLFDFNVSRNSNPGSHTVVATNDALGAIIFRGDDGDEFIDSAFIAAEVDLTPGNGDMPGRLKFGTSPDGTGAMREVFRVNAPGDMLYGKTSDVFNTAGVTIRMLGIVNASRAAGAALNLNRSGSDGATAAFHNDGTTVGSISVSGSSTAYNTSSDYRLKENVDYDWDATSRLKQLKPARFNFIITPDKTVDGFLAHEAQTVVPESVIGAKDATKTLTNVVLSSDNVVMTEDITQTQWAAGKLATTDDRSGDTVPAIYPSDSTWAAEHVMPDMQAIDQAKLVPLLVKTIQELEARITALEA